MSIIIEKLHPDFGASVTGIDLSEPLNTDTVGEIRDAIDTHSFLCFPNQSMNDDSQLVLTRALGKPEIDHVKFGRDGVVDYFGIVGNIAEDGTQRGNDHEVTKYFSGNNMWHSDSSFRQVPTFVSITLAYEVPDEGGATEFVSCRAAYARLPEATRTAIDPLHVVHDYVFSRSKVAEVKASHAKSLPPVPHRLVRTNPANGAKNYYVGSHAKQVEGWGFDDSRRLLDDLLDRATGAEDIYAHQWQVGDLVIWDNRCLLHRGRPFDNDRYRRRMHQTRVCGTGPTLDE